MVGYKEEDTLALGAPYFPLGEPPLVALGADPLVIGFLSYLLSNIVAIVANIATSSTPTSTSTSEWKTTMETQLV